MVCAGVPIILEFFQHQHSTHWQMDVVVQGFAGFLLRNPEGLYTDSYVWWS